MSTRSFHEKQLALIETTRKQALIENFLIDQHHEPEVRNYYTVDRPRMVIFEGLYQGQPARFVFWNDERPCNTAATYRFWQRTFNESRALALPQLFRGTDVDAHTGWIVIGLLPSGAEALTRPITQHQVERFVRMIAEVTECAAHMPALPTAFEATDSAEATAMIRIANWVRLCGDGEGWRTRTGKQRLYPNGLRDVHYEEVCLHIHGTYGLQGMAPVPVFSHGHLLPGHPYHVSGDQRIWFAGLDDMGHTGQKTAMWDWAMGAWASTLMVRGMSHEEMDIQLQWWIQAALQHTEVWNIAPMYLEHILHVALLERCLGTLLADIGATGDTTPELLQHRDVVHMILENLLSDVHVL